jgi:energy-coupling factor transporter ATP-binding protein EcfA2
MKYCIDNLGPIKEADLDLGDLTVVIGPQATGKTILLQTFKLIMDTEHTIKTIKEGALGFWKDIKDFQEIYYGRGVRGLITAKTKFSIDNKKEMKLRDKIENINPEKIKEVHRNVYYVPAQRSLVMENGWPGNLTSFTPNYPFVVKEFSEGIRLYLEYDLKAAPGMKIFPIDGLLREQTRNIIKNDIYREGEIKVNNIGTEQKIIIDTEKYNGKIPVTAWSTGQREFLPLLLFSYYILSPRGPGANLEGKFIIIEEPEMGLHPNAIYSFMFLAMDFLSRGAKVIISTHSVYILDILWTIKEMQKKIESDKNSKDFVVKKFLELFGVKSHDNTKTVAKNSLSKNFQAYFMKPIIDKNDKITLSTTVKISDLNPGSEIPEISGWGGLTEKSSHAADIVASLQ